MVSINSLALFPVGASASVILSTPAFQCLNDVHLKYTNFDNIVKGWKGDILGALPMLPAQAALKSSIDSCTTTLKTNYPTVISDQDYNTFNTATDVVYGDFTTTLNDINAQKSKFDAAGIAGILLSDLTDIKGSASNLGAAVVGITPAANKDVQQTKVNAVSQLFGIVVGNLGS
ncbi:hypothetical protein GLAREA_10713 [Glarea lozoyensis ATCC 20868]|nr:uncharacterized protein GLAREA_10713 [Glarea lozoyensis ATCC 20868]EPE35018.1 hypothetical protein GLAREA_10713 [Glarea lozoyensis ATCC 20868]